MSSYSYGIGLEYAKSIGSLPLVGTVLLTYEEMVYGPV